MADDTKSLALVKAFSIVVSVLFLAVIAVNALANALPINGVNTGQLSDEIPNLFVPAGLTFSIWGLIYLLLAGYCGAILIQAFRKGGTKAWEPADGAILSLNFAANIAWILAWHHRLVGLAMVLMLVIFGTLVWLEERNAARLRAGAFAAGSSSPLARFLLTTPINVYLGWICVATIANATALFVTAGWGGFGLDPRAWTVFVIAAGLSVGLLFIFLRGAVAAPLVIVWALAGIAIKRIGADMEYSTVIWVSAIASAAILAVAAIGRWFLSRRKA